MVGWARRLPLDLVSQLRAAGCYRMLVPPRLGGAGATLPEHVAMVRELARVDGSVGWTVMLGSSAPLIFGNLAPEAYDEIFAHADQHPASKPASAVPARFGAGSAPGRRP